MSIVSCGGKEFPPLAEDVFALVFSFLKGVPYGQFYKLVFKLYRAKVVLCTILFFEHQAKSCHLADKKPNLTFLVSLNVA